MRIAPTNPRNLKNNESVFTKYSLFTIWITDKAYFDKNVFIQFLPLLVVEVSSCWTELTTLLKSATNGAELKADSDRLSSLETGLSVSGLPSIGSMGCRLRPSRSWLGRLIWFWDWERRIPSLSFCARSSRVCDGQKKGLNTNDHWGRWFTFISTDLCAFFGTVMQ